MVRAGVCVGFFVTSLLCILAQDWNECAWNMLVAIAICPAWDGVPNARDEWCRADDVRMQTEADARHPLQRDS